MGQTRAGILTLLTTQGAWEVISSLTSDPVLS